MPPLTATNDIWIAATSLAFGAFVATVDSNFLKIAGLFVLGWKASRT